MKPTFIELLGTSLFAIAVLHTFLVKKFNEISHRFRAHSPGAAFFHLLGEIEVVFGFWAGIFLVLFAAAEGPAAMMSFHEKLHFTEPIFVFCIMVAASTRPVLAFAQWLIESMSVFLQKTFKFTGSSCDVFVILFLGPLAGSFITEPGAMTVCALLLAQMVQGKKDFPEMGMYTLLAVLFVNISVGGSLTNYAAPPILMVAGRWGWDLSHVFMAFGIKSIFICFINATVFTFFFRKQLNESFTDLKEAVTHEKKIPVWVTGLHIFWIAGMVVFSHYPSLVMGVFLFFIGLTTVTREYQRPLRFRDSLLVAWFLAGLIVFGSLQSWWLQPVLTALNEKALYFVATGLTAITDNAALTYLGAQVEGLSEASKYFLVAGALAGGGLTVIANAPNAAGYTLLQGQFPKGISPLRLFVAALLPTVVAVAFLGFYIV